MRLCASFTRITAYHPLFYFLLPRRDLHRLGMSGGPPFLFFLSAGCGFAVTVNTVCAGHTTPLDLDRPAWNPENSGQ